MEARAKIFGHPIHQMLIVLPFGMLAGSFLFDVVHLFDEGGPWAQIAYWLIVAGVLSGLLAAVFGLIDWLAIPVNTRARRIGAWHGLGNVLLLALFAGSWLLRREAPMDPSGTALLLSACGIVVSLVTGWLGGELVDRLGVGVDPAANLNAPSSLTRRPVDPGPP